MFVVVDDLHEMYIADCVPRDSRLVFLAVASASTPVRFCLRKRALGMTALVTPPHERRYPREDLNSNERHKESGVLKEVGKTSYD